MVLTTTSPPLSSTGRCFGSSPPKRGATLPHKINSGSILSSSSTSISALAGPHPRATRAHTLPNHVQTLNQMNNNRNSRMAVDFPIVSRNAPAHVSILSLPISDNEALNFDNR